jgi:uncharacterized lipoprotein YddW (UPF0748 family)
MGKVNSISWLGRLRFLLLTFLGFAIALMINFPFWALAQTPSISTASNLIDPSATNQSIVRPHSNELRGIWLTNVDSDVLFSTDRLERATKRLKRLNFNTIYPTVWNRGYTLYPSKVAKKAFGEAVLPMDELRNRDMLEEAVRFGHEQNFAVIPWFEYGFASSYQQKGGSIIAKKPEWAAIDYTGKLLTKNGFDWLNALDNEVQDFLLSLFLEVVKKYEVAGIQGDAVNTFLHPEIRKRFKHNIGAYGKSDYTDWNKVKHSDETFNHLDKHIQSHPR